MSGREDFTVNLDGDKGIYTQEEVVALLADCGIVATVSAEDGVVEEPTVEEGTGD